MKNVVMCILVLMIATATFGQGEPGMGQIWAKNPENPTFTIGGEQGSWHTGEVPGDYFNTCLVWDGTQYRLYFTGINEAGVRAIGYCTSDNPYEGWVEYENNPVFTAEDMDWGTIQVCSPYVIWDGSLFRMWFIGEDLTGHGQVGFASSVDGNTWTSHAAPVLSTNSAHTWENLHIGINIVLMENDSTYFMYYSAQGIGEGYSIGCATSSDGIAWTKMFDEPIIGHDQWHTFWVVASHVQKFGDTYVMWYAGSNSGIIGDPGKVGVATSADGINWHRDELFNPVMPDGPDGSWDDAMLSVISVLPYEDHYRALFCGVSTDIDSLRFGWADYTPTVIPAGDVSGTWTKAGSPIRVQGEITVPDGETLTIEAGTTVEFLGHYPLNVQGQILALGTEEEPIRFWVDDTLGFSDDAGTQGVWGGIKFIATPVTNDSSLLSYCDFRFGKTMAMDLTGGGAISIHTFSKLYIDHSLFQFNRSIATQAQNYAMGGALGIRHNSSPTVTNCRFLENYSLSLVENTWGNGGAIWIYDHCNPLISRNEFRCNHTSDTGAALSIWEDSDPVIMNNLIVENTAISRNGEQGYGGGVAIGWDSNPILINNTIVDNLAGWGAAGLYLFEGNAIVMNTIIAGNEKLNNLNYPWGHQWGGFHGESVHVDFIHSLLEGGVDLGCWGNPANSLIPATFDTLALLVGNPLLLSDHALSTNSPCLGSGVSSCDVDGETYTAPVCDCYGNPRPLPAGSNPDMGAFEHYLSGPETGGWEWVRHPDNPVFDLGVDGSWDDHSLALGSVLKVDGEYLMYYHACNDAVGPDAEGVGLATSVDGISWNRSPSNPIITPDPLLGENLYVFCPVVVYVGETYHIWYESGAPGNTASHIRYATSSDGEVWEKYAENPVMSSEASWEASHIYPLYAEFVGTAGNGWFRMWYGSGGKIGLAYSYDGIDWVRQNNEQPVLVPGPTGSWYSDYIYDVSVLRPVSGGFEMWLTGYDGTGYHFGHAVSTNGINWSVDPDPLMIEDTQAFDSVWQGIPRVLETEPGFYEMWYCGNATQPDYQFRIGYATHQPVGINDGYRRISPEELRLIQNYPNPFNPVTHIRYQLPQNSEVRLAVYDMLGREVLELVDAHQALGTYTVVWDGVDDSGNPVSTGVYFCRLQAGDFSKTIKMVLLR